MIDEHCAAPEFADAKFLTGVHDSVSDLLSELDRPLQFKTDLAGHPLPQCQHLDARDLDLPRMHELHVAQAFAGSLFQEVDRIWPGYLKVEQVVGLRSSVVLSVTKVVVRPKTAAAKQQEFLGTRSAQDAFVNDLAGIVGMNDVLRLTDVELGEAVD